MNELEQAVGGGILPEIITPGMIDEYLDRVDREIQGLAKEITGDTRPKTGFDETSFSTFLAEWGAFYNDKKNSFVAQWINQVETYDATEAWHQREVDWREKAHAAGLSVSADPSPPPPRGPGGWVDKDTVNAVLVIGALFGLGYAIRSVRR
jgi:hypothetical protein